MTRTCRPTRLNLCVYVLLCLMNLLEPLNVFAQTPIAELTFKRPYLAAAVSNDGARAAFSFADKTIAIYSLRDRQMTHVLKGHGEPVQGVLFLPGDRQLVSVGEKSSLRVWDTTSGNLVKKLNKTIGNTMVLSPDGATLIAFTRNLTDAFMYERGDMKHAYVIDVATLELKHQLSLEPTQAMIDIITQVDIPSFSSSSRLVAIGVAGLEGEPGDWDGGQEAIIVDVQTGKRVAVFETYYVCSELPHGLSPDGSLLRATRRQCTPQDTAVLEVANGKQRALPPAMTIGRPLTSPYVVKGVDDNKGARIEKR